MSIKCIIHVRSRYYNARKMFVDTIAKLVQHPENVENIINGGIVELVVALFTDVSPTIQSAAVLVIGQMGSYNEETAWKLMRDYNVVFHLLKDFKMKDANYHKAVLFALRCVGKHSVDTARHVANGGGFREIVLCLGSFDLQIKKAACLAAHTFGKMDHELAEIISNEGALPLIISCVEDDHKSIRKISISALGDISKLSKDAAKIIMERGGFHIVARFIGEVELTIIVLNALSNFATHSAELAQGVLATKVLPRVVLCVSDEHYTVRISAVNVILNVSKHTGKMAEEVLNEGTLNELMKILIISKSETLLCITKAIGYLASHSSDLAIQIAEAHWVYHLKKILITHVKNQEILTAAAWALGQIGKHSDRETEYLCTNNALHALIKYFKNENNSPELHQQCKETLKHTLDKCKNIAAMNSFLDDAPPVIQKYVACGLKNILPYDPKARYEFVITGGLGKLLRIKPEVGSRLMEDIIAIKLLFPKDIVRYYTPHYPEGFLPGMDNFYPELHPHFITEEEYKALEEAAVESSCHFSGLTSKGGSHLTIPEQSRMEGETQI